MTGGKGRVLTKVTGSDRLTSTLSVCNPVWKTRTSSSSTKLFQVLITSRRSLTGPGVSFLGAHFPLAGRAAKYSSFTVSPARAKLTSFPRHRTVILCACALSQRVPSKKLVAWNSIYVAVLRLIPTVAFHPYARSTLTLTQRHR